MKTSILSMVVLALTVIPVTASDVRLGSYRNPKSEGLRNAYRLYLDGVKSGLMSYQAWAKSHGGPAAFCMPADLAITAEQAEDIMLKSAERRAAVDEMLVSLLLLSGLQEAYPCGKAGDR